MKKQIGLLTAFVILGLLIHPATSFSSSVNAIVSPGEQADSELMCNKCHNKANWQAKLAQYRLSRHFQGNTSSRNSKFCARCHTSEGFQEISWNGRPMVSNDMPNGTRISCTTCHKHTNFDFSDDTLTQILRTTDPVFLNYDKNAKSTDFGETNNLCSTCHQIRGATALNFIDSTVTPPVVKKFDQMPFFPLDNKLENATVKYQVGQTFGVHAGNQSNLYAGINGYEYAGQEYARTWKHSDLKCTDCHMNKYDDAAKTGGHTLIVNKEVCTSCHKGDKLKPIEEKVDAKLTELAELLVQRKVFRKNTNQGRVFYGPVQTHDFFGNLFQKTESKTLYGMRLSNANTISPNNGLVVYGNSITMGTDPDFALRIGREWKYGELGAAYNYGYISSENTNGVHNPVYAIQLLQKSIDWLKAN